MGIETGSKHPHVSDFRLKSFAAASSAHASSLIILNINCPSPSCGKSIIMIQEHREEEDSVNSKLVHRHLFLDRRNKRQLSVSWWDQCGLCNYPIHAYLGNTSWRSPSRCTKYQHSSIRVVYNDNYMFA